MSTLPPIRTTEEVFDQILPYLCDMADMHYKAFRSIRQRGVMGGGDWLTRYYSLYGTPQVAPYARKNPRGRSITISGTERTYTLLLEGILDGLLGYIRVGAARGKLVVLQKCLR